MRQRCTSNAKKLYFYPEVSEEPAKQSFKQRRDRVKHRL